MSNINAKGGNGVLRLGLLRLVV